MSNLGILDYGSFVAVPEQPTAQSVVPQATPIPHVPGAAEVLEAQNAAELQKAQAAQEAFRQQNIAQQAAVAKQAGLAVSPDTTVPTPKAAPKPAENVAKPKAKPTNKVSAQVQPVDESAHPEAAGIAAFENAPIEGSRDLEADLAEPINPYGPDPAQVEQYRRALQDEEDMRLIDAMAQSAAAATGSPLVGQMYGEIQRRYINAGRMDQYGDELQAEGALRATKYTGAAEKDKALANTGMEEVVAENFRTHVKPQLDARFDQLFNVMHQMDTFQFDSKRVWNNKDTVDQALTVLGAGLAGLLNASFGQPGAPNSVINAYQQAVETDLQEQKLNFEKLVSEAQNARADIQQIDAMRESFNAQLDLERVLKLKSIDANLAAKIADQATPLVVKGGLMKQRAAIQDRITETFLKGAEKAYATAYNNLKLSLAQQMKQRQGGGPKAPESLAVRGNFVPGPDGNPFLGPDGKPIALTSLNDSDAAKAYDRLIGYYDTIKNLQHIVDAMDRYVGKNGRLPPNWASAGFLKSTEANVLQGLLTDVQDAWVRSRSGAATSAEDFENAKRVLPMPGPTSDPEAARILLRRQLALKKSEFKRFIRDNGMGNEALRQLQEEAGTIRTLDQVLPTTKVKVTGDKDEAKKSEPSTVEKAGEVFLKPYRWWNELGR